ncbi:uncharacterized protein LOC126668093 [Mercurialis annua]|uniref:uncharacterized protein LOC126668093 n=1 Tax=Mercurialis annua TaxID=3986 RepID=UPI0021600E5A|nr:uncharacterized protein LOC126668093 [Mercurialis annua]
MAMQLTATLFLLPIGLRRLYCSSSLFLKTPSLFKSKSWYISDSKLKNLDLYILIISLPIASFSEFFIFLSFNGHPTYHFAFLQQSLVLFLYWVLTILILLHGSSIIDPLLVNDSFLFACTGIVFFLEYLVIGKGISGVVSEVVYGLCGDLSVICGLCCLYLAVKPSAFFVEFCLCCGLVFKGTWFLQTGLCLYTDVFVFKGCQKVVVLVGSENAEVKCDLEEDGLRGVALVNLLFIGHAIGVLLVSLGMFALLSSGRVSRHGETSGPLLAGFESDGNSMRAMSEFELE